MNINALARLVNSESEQQKTSGTSTPVNGPVCPTCPTPQNSGTSVGTRLPESDDFEERAGLIADNPDMPREWVDGFTVMVSMPCPDDWPQSNWDKVLIAGEAFLAQWGDNAHKLGWTDEDLFGVSVKGGYARLDCRGLVLAIADARVTALTAETAVLQCLNPSGEPTGSILKYYRKPDMSQAVPAWELAGKPKNKESNHDR